MLAQLDGVWFRGQIIEDGICYFVDMGISQKVSKSNIVLAPAEYFDTPPLAVKYILSDICASNGNMWDAEEFSTIKQFIENKEFESEIVSTGSAGVVPTIRLTTDNGPVCDAIIGHGCGKRYENDHLQYTSISHGILPSGSHHVFVQYTLSAVKFWTQLACNDNISAALSDQLFQYLDSSPGCLDEQLIRPCMPCVAMYEDVPYRAVVVDVDASEHSSTVYFIDYGNTDEVPNTQMMPLPSNLTTPPALVLECSLSGRDVRNTDFDRILDCETIYADVKERTNSGLYIVSLSDSKPQSSVEAVSRPVKTSRSVSPLTSKYTPALFDVGAIHDTCICHVEEQTGLFYCQLLQNAKALDSLMASLQNVALEKLSLAQTTDDSPCLAMKDTYVYRAKLLVKQNGGAMVKFVDFGDEAFVQTADLYSMERGFMELPTQALCCSLSGAESRPLYVVCKMLNSFNSSRVFRTKVVLKTIKSLDVVLTDEKGVGLLDMIDASMRRSASREAGAPTAVKATIPPADVSVNTRETVYVTEILSNSEFFCQLCKYDADVLAALQEDIQKHCASPAKQPITSVKAGDFCLAASSDDDQFYRARVIQTDGSRCQVSFVDYGSEEMKSTRELLVIQPQFCRLPIVGVHCHLSSSYSHLPDGVIERLQEKEFEVDIVKRLQVGVAVEVPDTERNREANSVLAK